MANYPQQGKQRDSQFVLLVEHKLLGLLPLDADDEGLDPLAVDITVADIYRYFETRVQADEIALARSILAAVRE